jgi:predicted type IV restriction endonuclease
MQNIYDRFPMLNLPPAKLQLDNRDGATVVYDRLRQKWVELTPEEWVRQQFVAMLCSDKGFPAGLMANEVSLKLNATARRADTVVYDRSGKPLMIVEYKAPTVAITQKVFEQILRYYSVLGGRYLTVSNGLNHYCCRLETTEGSQEAARPVFLKDIPDYQNL